MRGREFLELAREVLPAGRPRHQRAAIVHAYYALLLECRDLLESWGFAPATRHQVHTQVRLRLIYSSDADLKTIGRQLERQSQDRNLASYDLQDLPVFASSKRALDNITFAENAIASLDAIDADPVRKAAAIASIRP